MGIGIYLNLEKDSLKETEKAANERSINSDINNESTKNELMYANCVLEEDSVELDGEEFHIYGTIVSSDDLRDLGFIELTFKPDLELVVSLIEKYVKKLNKIKSVLEAVKE